MLGSGLWFWKFVVSLYCFVLLTWNIWFCGFCLKDCGKSFSFVGESERVLPLVIILGSVGADVGADVVLMVVLMLVYRGPDDYR